MINTETRQVSDYYDYQTLSYVGYETKQIRKRYVLEYCDDKRLFNLCGERKPHGDGFYEIDDCYKSIIFEESPDDERSFDGIAMEMYLRFLFRDNIYDVKLYEEIREGDELIQERWIEMPSTFCHSFGKLVANDVMKSRDGLQKQVEALTKANELMKGFIKKCNAENIYEEYLMEAV